MAENEHYDEPGIDDDGSLERLRLKRPNATQVLPRLMLEKALGCVNLDDLSRKGACVVIAAPGPGWVNPLKAAADGAEAWNFSLAKNEKPRRRSNDDDRADASVAYALAMGGRVLGVSHDPENLLPAALLAAADIFLRVPPPDASILGQTIKEILGQPPITISDADFAGLGYDEISACIRMNSTPMDCVERLRRAASGKRRVDASVADAPHLRDVHGYGEAKQWGLNLIEDLSAWRDGEIAFDEIERMVILASPPGMGKTTFARSLARSTGLPLIVSSVGKWFAESPGYLDSIIKKIDEVFSEARASAPAILLLDELDALPSRATISPRGADWWLPIIAHMLTTLDGAEARSKNLIVLGATNYPEKLDSALVRSGRFSQVLHIPLPDRSDLVGIFRQHLQGELADISLEEVGALALGGTGADVVEWIKRARGIARRSKRALDISDLIAVLSHSDKGLEEELRRTAIHEAGHAVIAHVLGVAVHAVSIVERGASSGRTMTITKAVNTRQDLDEEVIRALSGRAAEEIVLSKPSAGAGGNSDSDLANATRWLGAAHLSFGLGDSLLFRADVPDIVAILQRDPLLWRRVNDEMMELYQATLALVRQHRPLVEHVAAQLLECKQLDGPAFLALVKAS